MGIHCRYSAPLLAILLSGTAFATERVAVDPYIKAGPGYTAATGSVTGYVPTKSNADLLLEAERKGWLGSGSAKTPVTVKPKVTVPVGGLTTKLKAGLKTNAAQLALGAAVSGAVAAVGWVMSDDNTKIQKKDAALSDGTPLASTGNTVNPQSVCTTYPASQVLGKIITTTYQNVTYAVATFPRTTSGVWTGPSGYTQAANNCTSTALGYAHNGGYWPSSFAKVIAIGDISFKKADLVESDWAVLDPWIASQSASWLKMLLSEVCGGTYGGVNPQACYDGLQKQSAAIITGPATVQGPKTTSTGTYTRADGSTGTTSSTTNTTYNITYGDQFFDYTTNTTTTNMKDGQVTDTNTTTDAGTPQEKPPEEKPEEEEKDYVVTDTALPKVDPFYEQQYPDGLQGVWNDKQAEFQDSAFVSFLHSFVPSFSGSCPAFSLSFAIASWANYGTIQFSSICYALDLVKVVILVSALFLCRALIFGG